MISKTKIELLVSSLNDHVLHCYIDKKVCEQKKPQKEDIVYSGKNVKVQMNNIIVGNPLACPPRGIICGYKTIFLLRNICVKEEMAPF